MANMTEVVLDYYSSRCYRERYSPLEIGHLSEETMRSVYRFNGEEMTKIANDLQPFLEQNYENTTLRGKRLSTIEQVIIAMKFYGHGSSFRNLSEQYGVGIGTVSRVIQSMTKAIQQAYKDLIKLPTTHGECRTLSNEFHDIAGFPNVIGCVDGCLIPIKRPTVNEHVYVCRKGYHAINAMFVCRPDLRFTFVDASFPGATQDAAVYRESQLRAAFMDHHIPQGYLIGDSGYGLSNNLLTPVPHPGSGDTSTLNYNRAHRRTRNCVERSFGVLKSRFRCIDKSGGPLRFTPSRSANIINAVSLLHNLAIEMRVPLTDPLPTVNVHVHEESEQPSEDAHATAVRNHVISLF